MHRKYWKKLAMALGCAVVLLAGVLPVGISWDKYAMTAEIEMTVKMPYQSVREGEELRYELSGYEDGDIISTKWYSGNVLVSQSGGVLGYTVKSSDEEKFISYEVKTRDGNTYRGQVYFSKLPVLYIDSDSTYDSFQVKTEEYTETTINLVSGDYGTEQIYSGEAGLRLRGNSTSALGKKPFKLKLDAKSDLLGMGKNKHWVLLANAIDSTNMRNKLLYDFSGDIGAESYTQSENISMVYNGEYMGVYQLCEQIRIGDNRVEIYNWEDAAEETADVFLKQLQAEGVITKNQRKEISGNVEDELKADYSWISDNHFFYSYTLAGMNIGLDQGIDLSDYVDFTALELPEATGGALLEMDFYTGEWAELLTAYRQPYYFDTPENGVTFTELYDYMKEYVQTVEYALHDTDFIYNNTDVHYRNTNQGYYDWRLGKRLGVQYARVNDFVSQYENMHYSELLDMDSAVTNFLVCEFSRNWDSMKNSAFMYKDIDGKLIMGPAWDFDWAWGNSMYGINTDFPTGWSTTDEYFANEQYYQTVQWNRALVRDPYFLQRVYEKYQEIRGTVIEDMIKDGGLIDTYYETYKNASHANDEKWGGSMGSYGGACYDDEVARMKAFVTERTAWLDQQFTSVETLRTSIGSYVTSSRINIESVDTDAKAGYTVITAKTTESTAQKISFQINGTYVVSADVVNGKAVVEIPDAALTENLNQSNVVQVRAVNANGDYVTKSDGSITGEYTNAVSNYAVFDKEIKLVLNAESQLEITSGTEREISAVKEGTTVFQLTESFANTSVTVLDQEGNRVTDMSREIGTGWRIQLFAGSNVTDEASVILAGDTDGNGQIDVIDMEEIQKDILGIRKLTGVYVKAAKGILGSDILSVLDMEAVQRYILHIVYG